MSEALKAQHACDDILECPWSFERHTKLKWHPQGWLAQVASFFHMFAVLRQRGADVGSRYAVVSSGWHLSALSKTAD